jgi:glycosyltransferase involved in cell wall biosynthesis
VRASLALPQERRRILYVMHVDWNVLRQRPQALTQELSELPGFDVFVAYLPNWRRAGLTTNVSRVRRAPIPRLPFVRFRPILWLNQLMARAFLRVLAFSWRPDATIVTSGAIVAYLPRALLRRKPLFYDCMDLATGFAGTDEERHIIAEQERDLLARMDGLFASSNYIIDSLRASVRPGVPMVLVRNGFDGTLSKAPFSVDVADAGMVRLGYFGAISYWFDWKLIRAALRADDRLEFHAWGPIDGAPEPHDRIFLHGPVEHRCLPEVVGRVDALLMPFKVDDLIRGVDPIKIYEYLALGRPVITVHYDELNQFAGLVNFYSTESEFIALLSQLRDRPRDLLPDPDELASFLASSTWRSRALVMAEALRLLLMRDTTLAGA